ncbi:(2Fe-2S)-binding protein [Luteipulveratus sp. YIM 133132]|uniref:(2Fe-2S)-binding protein n=1 Tax=Luteipulveratus flavus TaxID=3031728 RepID=UPI0023B12A25|nr:(2Fe-2S)-binding protein [Luteipulveratus sp. YIM 133132]MDE9364955.1 (2Fe-2S)-binding protein [Luteipulveratus sp. YIM 133132]
MASPYALDLAPDRLSVGLSGPGGFADRLGVGPGPVEWRPRLSERRGLAERTYRTHAQEFASTYEPGVKMSSAHRAGSVEDAWQAAWAGASRAVLGWAPPDRWRDSCCFIYALPGAHECARCPRLR